MFIVGLMESTLLSKSSSIKRRRQLFVDFDIEASVDETLDWSEAAAALHILLESLQLIIGLIFVGFHFQSIYLVTKAVQNIVLYTISTVEMVLIGFLMFTNAYRS